MKKYRQLGLLLLLLGLALFVTGYQGSGRDIRKINGRLGFFELQAGGPESAETRQYDSAAQGLHRIVMDEGNAVVRVVPSPDSAIHVVYQESEGEPLEISNENGTLSILRRGKHFGIYLGSCGDSGLVTELQLPSPLALDLNVRSSNGIVTVDDITLRGGAIFSTDNGKILLSNVSLQDLTAESSNGDIRLSGACKTVELYNDNGSITVEGLRCASLHSELSNGAIRLSAISSDTDIYAETSNGAITLEAVSAKRSLSLETNNGAIRGTLAGKMADYSIQAETSLGKCNLPNDWGHGDIRLSAFTDLGTIDIRFTED